MTMPAARASSQLVGSSMNTAFICWRGFQQEQELSTKPGGQ